MIKNASVGSAISELAGFVARRFSLLKTSQAEKVYQTYHARDLNRISRLRLRILLFCLAAVLILELGVHGIGFDRSPRPVSIVRVPRAPISAHLIVQIVNAPPTHLHFVEHLSWLNTFASDREVDRHSNAWTNDHAIGYRLSGPSDDLADMLKQLKRVFDPIDLPRAFAEQERGILEREYELRVGGTINAKAALEMEPFLYQGNQIAGDPIGTPELIRALNYDDAKSLHAETHRPERARLVVIGDVSETQFAKAMEEAGFPDLGAKRDDIASPPFALASLETRIFRYPDPNAAPRMILRKVVALPEPLDFDLLEAQIALVRTILDSNLPGGLAGPLRFDAFITKSFGISIEPVDESHIELIFSAEPDKGIGFAAMQSAFEGALTNSARGVPATTYDRVLKRFKGFWPDWSNEDETARWFADYTLSRIAILREPKSERQLRKIGTQIDVADIDKIIEALSGPGRTAIAFIGTDPKP